MIKQFTPVQSSLVLETDSAGEFPLYLYWPANKSTLLYSNSINELLDDKRVLKPLKVSTEGISFLLQSTVIPPPKTAYEDIYILGVGDKAKVLEVNGKVEITFIHEFPFLNANRMLAGEMETDQEFILQLLSEATISRIDQSKPSFLFHSAGKDSNSIALALAEAGWQDMVTLITHKSKGQVDESEISAKIAKRLGFKHQILHEVDHLQAEHIQAIDEYFIHAPFPSTDNVTLAYPLYAHQLPKLKGANIIEGGGNDSYMSTPPSQRELKLFSLSKLTHHLSFMRNFVRTESLLTPLIRTPAEWCGTSGLSFFDTKKILTNATNVYAYWQQQSESRRDWDLFDFKTSILTPIIASESHIRKARNFANAINADLILPFANQHVAEYFAKMPEQHLFDRQTLKNKLILRKMLKERNIVDSDALGKMGYSYDSSSVVSQNWGLITSEIENCKLWNQKNIQQLLNRMKLRMTGKGWSAAVSARMIYRLYLLSGWHNKNRYIRT